jgi:hypothetical protein
VEVSSQALHLTVREGHGVPGETILSHAEGLVSGWEERESEAMSTDECSTTCWFTRISQGVAKK